MLNTCKMYNIPLILDIDRSRLVSNLDTLNPETSSYCGEFSKLARSIVNLVPKPEYRNKINQYALGRTRVGIFKIEKHFVDVLDD